MSARLDFDGAVAAIAAIMDDCVPIERSADALEAAFLSYLDGRFGYAGGHKAEAATLILDGEIASDAMRVYLDGEGPFFGPDTAKHDAVLAATHDPYPADALRDAADRDDGARA